MTGEWVAVGVRARAVVARCLPAEVTRSVAASASLPDALQSLADTQYGSRLRGAATVAAAQRAVTQAMAWNARVLAGWAPRRGTPILRALIGGLELANVVDRLQRLAGAVPPPPYELGAVATAWPRLAAASTPDQVRRALAASPWGDPGATGAREVSTYMQAVLRLRQATEAPVTAPWAGAAVLLLLAREHIIPGRPVPAPAARAAGRLVGPAAVSATTLGDLTRSAPAAARWVLDGVDGPGDLWPAELRLRRRVADDARTLVRRPLGGPGPLIGAVAAMDVDCWRVGAALEAADRGGGPAEVLDALA